MSAPQPGPSMPPTQVNRPRPARNPFVWIPPAQVQQDIRAIVHFELFSDFNVSREETGNVISYRMAQVSFDENLRPHLVFAAFWTPDSLRTPLITIRPARGTPIDWDQCYEELRFFVLAPHMLYPRVSVLFSDGEHTQFHGPHAITLDSRIVDIVYRPDIYGILTRRSARLRARLTQPLEERQRVFFQSLLPHLEGMLDENITSQQGVQEFIHRFRAHQ
ncbi:hypothetical protein F5Y03DRAFT_399838 [Xylaria venustula]|nr:hypothetical protein F5Y03DRAFT_399838 [Xylaria venustula]